MAKITLKDIAARTGVSVSAVSLALNHRPGISDATRELVLREAEQAGYPVKKQRRSRSGVREIMLLYYSNDQEGPNDAIFAALLNSLTTAAYEANCTITLRYISPWQPLNRDAFGTCSGILFFGAYLPSLDILDEVLSLGLPTVLFDREAPERPCNSVSIDNDAATTQLFQWFWSHGYRRIAMINNTYSYPFQNCNQRQDAYFRCAREVGMTPSLCTVHVGQVQQELTDWYQELPQPPDAVIVTSDFLAIQVLPLLAGLGLMIGDNCAAVSFDNLPMAVGCTPPLSSMNLHHHARAVLALERLLSLIEQPDQPVQRIRLGTDLVIRESIPRVTPR